MSATARVIAVAMAALLVPGLFQGCRGCTCEECFANGVARSTRTAAVEDYVYSAPLSKTDAALAEVLAATGNEPMPRPLARGESTTLPNKFGDEGLTVTVVPAGSGYRVHVTQPRRHASADGGREPAPERDLDLEWRLASKVDPAFEAATAAKATEREERAKSIGRGCDRGYTAMGCGGCSHDAP